MNKRLLVALCQAMVTGLLFVGTASGVTYTSYIDFENQNLWGKRPSYKLDEEGGEGRYGSRRYWYYDGSSAGNESIIKKYADAAFVDGPYSRFGKSVNPRPSYMQEAKDNKGFLNLAASQALLRAFEPIETSAGPDDSNLVYIPDDGALYVDTLLRFAADISGGTAVCNSAAKLAALGDKIAFQMIYDEKTKATNLVISAGTVNAYGVFGVTNFIANVKVVSDRWYRLTAKAISNATGISGETCAAFEVFLDGVRIDCTAAEYAKIGEGAAALLSVNDAYQANALFLSMQANQSSVSATALTGVAMTGSGGADSIAVTDSNPIAVPGGTIDVKFICDDAALTKLVIKANGEVRASVTEPPFNGTVVQVHPSERITVEAACVYPYMHTRTLSFSGNVNAIETRSLYNFTMIAGNADNLFPDPSPLSVIISTQTAYYKVANKEFSVFEEAVAYATETDDHMISLQTNLTLIANSRDQGQAKVYAYQTAVLDLKGYTIKGEQFDEEAAIYNQGVFTIINSDPLGRGGIEAPGMVLETVSSNDAVHVNHQLAIMTLGAIDSYQFTVKGRVKCSQGELILRTGKYLTPPDESDALFYLSKYVDSDGRYEAAGPEDRYYTVYFNDKLIVNFEVAHGGADPSRVVVVGGSLLTEPVVTNAIGYTVTGWTDKATGKPWDFATSTVAGDMTLVANQQLDNYNIAYSHAVSQNPNTYNVEMTQKTLLPASRDNFDFCGWYDTNWKLYVESVGRDAYFAGTNLVVTGDLQLVAQWQPKELRWTNAGYVESNGWYSGSWEMTLSSKTFTPTTELVVDEIVFSVVNPTMYPDTAPYLAITNESGVIAYGTRKDYVSTSGDGLYTVAPDGWINGRARVGYVFTDLTIKAGSPVYALFSSDGSSVVPKNGYLRFTLYAGDETFKRCLVPGGTLGEEKGADYLKFYPVYEVRGHVKEGTEE